MRRTIRYAMRAIINVGSYESIHVDLEETQVLDDASDAQRDRARDRLMSSVKDRLDQEVVSIRRAIGTAKKPKTRE